MSGPRLYLVDLPIYQERLSTNLYAPTLMKCEAPLAITLIRKHKTLLAFLALTCFIAGMLVWDTSAQARGQLVARLDVARGRYVILTLGLPARWLPEYTRLLRKRYGIEHGVVAGCIVDEALLGYAYGYNAVSMDAANRKFGHDIFKEARAEAITSMNSKPSAAIRLR